MNIDRVREFIELAETGSFKNAAQHLRLPINVLSTRFQRFEKSLNVSLFSRKFRQLELTEAGKLFLPYAYELVEHYQALQGSLKQLQSDSPRGLRIQICSHRIPPKLTAYLESFCRCHPWLDVDLFEVGQVPVRDGLTSGTVDLAVVLGREDSFSDISGRIALDHRKHPGILVPDDHPLAGRAQISFSELSGETFVLYPRLPEPLLRELQLSLLRQSRIPYQVYEETSSPLFYKLFVAMGKGVLINYWDSSAPPDTIHLELTDEGCDIYAYLLYRTDSSNPAVHPFIEGLKYFMAGNSYRSRTNAL